MMPVELVNLGLIPFIGFVGWLIATGKLASGRELAEKNDEIRWLRGRNEELVHQNGLLLREQAATTIEILDDLRNAAREVRE